MLGYGSPKGSRHINSSDFANLTQPTIYLRVWTRTMRLVPRQHPISAFFGLSAHFIGVLQGRGAHFIPILDL
jgi:hypothetical protein